MVKFFRFFFFVGERGGGGGYSELINFLHVQKHIL